MTNVTNYFRNALATSNQGTHEYKDNSFCTLTLDEIKDGTINSNQSFISKYIFSKETDFEFDKENQVKPIIIALKTVSTDFDESKKTDNNLEEMVSVLFMPATLKNDGKLMLPDDGKLPWIPREYLTPIEEPQLAISSSEKYDEYLENTTDVRNQIESWQDYLQYAIEMFEYVTDTSFEDKIIYSENNQFKFDGKYYLFEDKSVNASFHILQLYNDLKNSNANKLYRKLMNGQIETKKQLFNNSDITKLKKHVGQMGGEYSLSPSQREAINHFDEIDEGDILAVSGPPGTGKTTLLQSVVANMYVNAALSQKDAPIIVASSTNNQAVTNIIDSFGKINSINLLNIEKKWITGSNSFATYFPSKGKKQEAIQNNYQYTSVNGEAFFDEIESNSNREIAKINFIKEYSSYYGVNECNLSNCQTTLWSSLNSINNDRIDFILKIEELKAKLGDFTYETYLNQLENNKIVFEKKLKYIKDEIDLVNFDKEKYLLRKLDWKNLYEKIPWYVKFFKFIPFFKKKIQDNIFYFFKNDELDYLSRDMSIDQIDETYHNMIINQDDKVKELKGNIIEYNTQRQNIQEEIDSLTGKWLEFIELIIKFEKYNIILFKNNKEIESEIIDICEFNNLLDKVRYVMFWFAVHYYECRWLIEDNPITDKQKGKTFENVLNIMYQRLAMISPCMVMTFFMLPKQFNAYNGNEKKHYYMYNYIDLLIVDEAGQISPEIAAPSFSLAKKAIVVGDEKQIPPVWGTVRALDIAMAKRNGLIETAKQFTDLENNGLNCSQSSIMHLASLSCAYDKYEQGLFLSEHRRCYDDIVEYCNKLVYGGKLEAKRGIFNDDDKNVIKNFLPPIGYKQITIAKAQTSGTSKRNIEEANQIISWLKKHFSLIVDCYQESDIDKKELVGVITPFKSQSALLKRLIKRDLEKYSKYISVGTVHTFQGAERRIIIFSSVYGNKDGCFFINKSPNIMNVAVSRAKDSFIVFGDRGCLSDNISTPAGLLKSMAVEID